MPGFTPQTYENLLIQSSETQKRLFMQYSDANLDYDVVIVGSGMGGGILADDLADNYDSTKRILVLEAGSYLFPTHVHNLCRFHNYEVAQNYAARTFAQPSQDSE